MTFKKLLPFILLFVGMNSGLCRQPDAFLFDTSIHVGKLENGFKYYFKRIPGEKRIYIELVVKAGTLMEDKDQVELAHLLEHMAFVGTDHFPNAKQYFVERGINFGNDLNARTTSETTNYYLKMPADSLSLINDGLLFMRDCAHGMLLQERAIDVERGTVLSEIRLGRDPDSESDRRILARLSSSSHLVNIHQSNSVNNLKTFQHSSLYRFYDDWYRPELQSLIVVGDFDPEQLEKKIIHLFGDLKTSKQSRPLFQLTDDIPLQRQWIETAARNGSNGQLAIYFRKQNERGQQKYQLKKVVADELTDLLLANRFNAFRQQLLLTHIVYNPRNFLLGANISTFEIKIKQDSLVEKQDITLLATEIWRLVKYGITEEEFKKVAGKLLENYRQKAGANTMFDELEEIWQLIENDKFIPDETNFQQRKIAALKKVSVKDINAIIKNILSVIPDVAIKTASGRQSLTLKEFDSLWNKIEESHIEPFHPVKEKDVTGLSFLVKPRTTNVGYKLNKINGATRIYLGNSIQVYLINSPDGNVPDNTLQIYGSRPHTIPYDTTGIYCPSCLLFASQGPNANPEKIQKDIDDQGIHFFQDIDKEKSYVMAMGRAEQAETLLQLIYLAFQPVVPDRKLYDGSIRRSDSAQRKILSNAQLFNYLIDSVEGKDVSAVSAKSEQLLLFDQTLKAYQDEFSDASKFTFFITGKMDTQLIVNYIRQYLGGLQTADTKLHGQINFVKQSIPQYNFTYESESDKAFVRFVLQGEHSKSQIWDMKLGIIKTAVENTLFDRLRTREGMIYYIAVSFNTQRNAYSFSIAFDPSGDSAKAAVEAAIEQLKQLTEHNESSYAIWRSAISGFKASSNRSSVFKLQEDLDLGIDPTDAVEPGRLIDLITIDDLISTASDLFFINKSAVFIMRPKNK